MSKGDQDERFGGKRGQGKESYQALETIIDLDRGGNEALFTNEDDRLVELP